MILDRLAEEHRLTGAESRSTLEAGATTWTADQVWAVLRHIIHRTGPVPLRDITPNARLLQDLDLG